MFSLFADLKNEKVLVLAFLVGLSVFFVEHDFSIQSFSINQPAGSGAVTPEIAESEGIIYVVNFEEHKTYCERFDDTEDVPDNLEVFNLTVDAQEDCRRMGRLPEFENYFNRNLDEETEYEEEVILEEGLRHVDELNYTSAKYLKERHQEKFLRDDEGIIEKIIFNRG